MPCAWSGTLADLKHLVRIGEHETTISNGFRAAFFKPTEAEKTAWRLSLPALLDVFSDHRFDSLQIILELQMPVGAERADVVLLGGTSETPKAAVIELKQWSRIKLVPQTYEVEVPGLAIHQHPSIQALNYVGKLHFFNSRAHNYDFIAAAYLHNASSEDKSALTQGVAADWSARAPLYINSEKDLLSSSIRSHLLPIQLDSDEHEKFHDAPYDQSNQLFSFLRSHAQNIAKGAAFAVANVGMGLTTEQDRLKNEILLSVSQNHSSDFIVQGGPGSGKTLLAVSLLLKAAEHGYSCILALRNNRLQAILRGIFDEVYPGASGMMMFFEPRQGKGIAHFNGHVDLLICDEAQRMESKIMPNVLQKATVCAIFLDETQRLNPPEQGTRMNFARASQSVNRTPRIRTLSASVRVPLAYSDWIEKLLAEPYDRNTLNLVSQLWKSTYKFQVCSSIHDLIDLLIAHRTPKDRAAMVASFTESPGNTTINHPDNLRIGYPLTSGFDLYRGLNLNIPWLMTTSHYKQFWIGGASNNLDRVASIYGAQGFESDYVGLIWGRDFLYREGSWTLGDPNVSYDAIDRLLIGRIGNRRWDSEALSLMINRYRIFLTRGIKGTVIYCEDRATKDYLLSL